SINTHATSARHTGPPPTPDIPNNCAGGYGDNKQLEDDSHKRAAVILASLAKGKRRPSTQSTSIVEVTATEVTKDSAAPSLKRKGPEIEYVSSSEQEDNINIGKREDLGGQEEDETYEPEEELEEASQLPAWLDITQSLRKTNATSVTITEKPSKKVKLESSESQVHLSASQSTTTTSNTQSLSTTTPNTNASTGQHFKTTSLPSSLSKDGKWRKAVITTLCLWAASQPDVWNISKQEISDALKEILPVVYPELPCITQDLNTLSAPAAVAYQCLCKWRHRVGSAAIALFTSFFAGSSDDDIQVTTSLLLMKLAFLYEDFDHSDPNKAFHSTFIIRLLATTHLHCIRGHAHIPALNTQALAANGGWGIIGLCGAALNCALRLLHHGQIQVSSLSPSSSKGKTAIKTPLCLNKASRRESTTACAFSEQNWGSVTRKLTVSVSRQMTEQITTVIELVRVMLLDEMDAELEDGTVDSDYDEYLLICKLLYVLMLGLMVLFPEFTRIVLLPSEAPVMALFLSPATHTFSMLFPCPHSPALIPLPSSSEAPSLSLA
ncbi:hypothetical protein BDN67DRAFT_1017110, partial [Paxillus ammoniavirescens]